MLNKVLSGFQHDSVNKKRGRSFTDYFDISNAIWGSRDYTSFSCDGYMRNVVAFRSINMVADSIASVKLNLYRSNNVNAKLPVIEHPVLDLLEEPNSIMSGIEFVKSIVSHLMISGNAYIYKLGNDSVRELHVLRPDRMKIVPGNTIPKAYVYNVDGKSRTFGVNTITGQSDIIHIKNFHPLNDWYGMSPMESAAYSIDQHNQACNWNQSMLKNGARPSGAIVVKNTDGSGSTLSSDQYEKVKEQIQNWYTGSNNSGRPILLEGGLDWKEMSISPRDMDFVNSKHSAARDIALAFGVPSQLIGVPGESTYNNMVEARICLWEQTVLPALDNILSHLNSKLVSIFGSDLVLGYNKDDLEVLSSKREKMWDYVENASFMTTNEKRRFFGLCNIKSSDDLEGK